MSEIILWFMLVLMILGSVLSYIRTYIYNKKTEEMVNDFKEILKKLDNLKNKRSSK